MISEGAVRGAILFYFYSFLNDQLAVSAAKKTVQRWQKISKEGEGEDLSDFVQISHHIWKKMSNIA